jgi:hypothetical protein
MKKFCLTSFTAFLSFLSFSQNSIGGQWFGTADVQITGDVNNYMTEVTFEEKGKTITGHFNYYFRDTYQSVELSATYNQQSQSLIVKEFPMLHYANTNTANGVDVMMEGELKLKKSRVETTLEGYFVPTKKYRNSAPEIKVLLKRYTEEMMEEDKKTRMLDSMTHQMEMEKIKTQQLVIPTVSVKDVLLIDAFKGRRNTIQQVIVTDADSVTIKLYDNGDIDNDSVSVFMNGGVVKANQMLKEKATVVEVKFDASKDINDVTLFADNLGLYPPNTAMLIMEVEGQRYEVHLSSSLINNATVRFSRKTKREKESN